MLALKKPYGCKLSENFFEIAFDMPIVEYSRSLEEIEQLESTSKIQVDNSKLVGAINMRQNLALYLVHGS